MAYQKRLDIRVYNALEASIKTPPYISSVRSNDGAA